VEGAEEFIELELEEVEEFVDDVVLVVEVFGGEVGGGRDDAEGAQEAGIVSAGGFEVGEEIGGEDGDVGGFGEEFDVGV
jgi:hypothetical protein